MALWAVLSEPRQLHHIKLPFKPLALDVSPPPGGVITDETPRAVIAMTGRSVYIYETKSLRALVDRKAAGETIAEADWTPAQTRESTLKFMVRDVRCMPDGEGELAMHHIKTSVRPESLTAILARARARVTIQATPPLP